MKLSACIASAAISALVILGGSVGAFAQSDCKTLVKPSPFGPADEVGVDVLGPEIGAAIQTIRRRLGRQRRDGISPEDGKLDTGLR